MSLTSAQLARLAAKTRNLADDFAEAGYVEMPDWLRALADITEGKFPCGHELRAESFPGRLTRESIERMANREPSGPPIDGREVDRAPAANIPTLDYCHAQIFPSWSNRWIRCGSPMRNGRCIQYGHRPTPPTDGGVSADPPGTTPPSPHATKES